MRRLSERIALALLALYALALVLTWPAIAKSDEQTEPTPIYFMALQEKGQMSSLAPEKTIARMSLNATITGYSAEVAQTDDTPTITANGDRVYSGGIACPSKFPFGTRLLIGGNEYTCNDRMNKRFPDRFDIFFESRAEAIHFGFKTMKVLVLE